MLDMAMAAIPRSSCFVDASSARGDLARRAISELKWVGNWSASPGYPFQFAHSDLRSLVEHDAHALVLLAVNVLDRWMSISPEECRSMDPQQLTDQLYSWPNRVFIKNEPHSLEKARAGRWRIVVGVSAPVVLAQRVLLGAQHRLMVECCEETPSSIGLGLNDLAIDALFAKAEMVKDSGGLTSSDQSGYDWRSWWFWAEQVATAWVRATGAVGRWRNGLYNMAYCIMASYFVLSNGDIYRLMHVAVTRSGNLDTGPGNSILRLLLNLYTRSYLREIGYTTIPASKLPCISMGDDCVESFGCPVDAEILVDIFARMGFKLTDVFISPDGSTFEFCSARFSKLPERGCAVLSWPRILYRLLSGGCQPSHLEQFKYELRHLQGPGVEVTLADLLAFIDWAGSGREPVSGPINTTENRVLHSGLCSRDMSKVSKSKKGRAGTAKPGRDAELRAGAKKISQAMPTKALGFQMKTISDPLTHQDLAIMSYLHTLADPWVEDPAGVPLMAGGTLMRRTVKAQLKFEVQATANASGFACVLLACDGWTGDATLAPVRYAAYSGATQGYPVWYTGATFAGTSLPAAANSTATTGLNAVQMPLLDGQVTSTSNVRMVAAGIRVFSDASVTTAQGKLCVVATSRPYGTAAQGALQSSSYATISTLPTDVMSFQSQPCAGWNAGHSLYAVAIPSDPECFTFFNPATTGQATVSYPQLGAILTGAASGQTFTAQLVMDYEFDIGVSNLTGVDTDPVAVTTKENLVPHIAMMHEGKTGKGNANQGLGMQAMLAQTALTRPSKLPALLKPSDGLLSKVGGAAQAALGWAAKKGLDYVRGFAKGVPILGGIMNVLGL